VRSDRITLAAPDPGEPVVNVAAIEYQGASVQVHLVADRVADSAATAGDPDADAPGRFVAVLPDNTFYAAPYAPGQRVAMRWWAQDAHALAA
jgi:putative spermidine/putrescine transport system ATP-binding protein